MYPWRHNMVWREGCETRPMVSGRTWGLFGVGERHRMVGCGGVCVLRVWCVKVDRVEVEGPALI